MKTADTQQQQQNRGEQCATLADLLRLRAERQPDSVAYRFLLSGDADGPVQEWTYGGLALRAHMIAARLQQEDASGQRVLLLYPPGLEFIAAFLGCACAGVVAVPTYPHRTISRLELIVRDAQARFVLTTTSFLKIGQSLRRQAPELAEAVWIATDELQEELASKWQPPQINGESLAFLQYTSGSTGQPKGVMVSHANILHNERMIMAGFGTDAAIHVVGWLPVYHDMGLIGNVLHPFFLGASCTLMSPLAFLQRPLRWLSAISRFRGTVSGGPNFAYDLCVDKLRPEHQFDLSSWNVAFNGSEPVRNETLKRFSQAFARHGFRHQAFYPCYGLAESTLFVTGSDRDKPPVVRTLIAEALERNLAIAAPEADANVRSLVSSGHPQAEQRVRIVDPETLRTCAENTVGEIWISGPSLAKGYWRRPQESEHTFSAKLSPAGDDAFLRTGDLGFLNEGELFVTGRLKDLLIIRGRNLYPQDIEFTAQESHPAVRQGGCAAFSLDSSGEEKLALAAEVVAEEGTQAQAIADTLRRAIAAEHGAHIQTVILLRAKSLPKTSSGKVQRNASRQRFLSGELDTIAVFVADDVPPPELEQQSLGAGGAEAPSSLSRELESVDREARQSLVEKFLQAKCADRLRVLPAEINLASSPAGIGLDSLMTAELQNEIEEKLGMLLPEGFLPQQPTLQEAASQLLGLWEAHRGEVGQQDFFIQSRPIEGGVPLSSGQHRLWFIDRLSPGNPVYNIHFGLRMKGLLDRELLQHSLRELIDRHAILRTIFREINGLPQQFVLAAALPEIEVKDFQDVPGGNQENHLRSLATALASGPFDLSCGPLSRFHLVVLGEKDHVLLITQHHIITDGWSVMVLARELAAIYDAFARKISLQPLPELQFTDYARWEEAHLPKWQADRAFWATQLSALPRLDLPADHPRLARPSYRGGRVALSLPYEAGHKLVAMGREEDCTPFVTLLAGFLVFLHRHTGQDSFAVGSFIANRGRSQLRNLIGFLANTVVLRCDLEANSSFRELVRNTRMVALNAFRHGHLPFGEVIRLAGESRGGGDDNPLFQTSLVLENTPLPALDVTEMTWEPVFWSPDGAVEGTAKFDLSLAFQQTDQGFIGALEYSERFAPETIQHFVSHLESLYRGIVEAPDQPVATLPMLSASEQYQVLVEWNSTVADVPLATCFMRLFEQQVEHTPGRTAAIDEKRSLSYSQLNAEANRVARHLRQHGVGPEVVVALLMNRSLDLLISILGVFKAGGAYLPLDPEHPSTRQLQVLQQSGARHLVRSRSQGIDLGQAVGDELQPLNVFLIEDLLSVAEPEANLPAAAEPSHLAYVIYTSGSTGIPKGAMVENCGMLNHLYAKVRDLQLQQSEKIAETASQCFDISVWQFLSALLTGGCVEVIPEEIVGDPRGLFEKVAAARITILEIVPSLLRATLEEIENGRMAAPDLSALRWMVLTGEALAPELARRWLERYPAIPVLNAYGPTECSDDVTHHEIHQPESLDPIYMPIGRPIINTRLYVLDRWLQPIPVGVPGELYVAGTCVGRGYLNDPVRTAQTFVPDLFAGGDTGRLYRTGDLVRFQPDGAIVFLGRTDHQVKIRGFRIELGEIESALEKHPAVLQAVVTVHEDEHRNKHLVAYVVFRSRLDLNDLQETLRQRLPDYMVPATFMVLEAMPLTPNGKIDRKALPAPAITVSEENYVAPQSTSEEILAGIWAEVLGVGRVGVKDDFFAVGGHSLLATQVMSRIRTSFGVDLPLRLIFEASTIGALAQHIDRALGTRSDAAPPITRRTREIEMPLSFAQQRLWFIHQLEPEDASYNVPGAVRVRGALDVGGLEKSLREILRRHESLRTRFIAIEGEPLQIIGTDAQPALAIIDLSETPAQEREAEVVKQAQLQAQQPFNLEQGPLLRVTLLKLAEQDYVLVLVMHHIISDGWSLGVLIKEVSALYEAFSKEQPSPLPELPIQYADFSAWQREWLIGEILDRQVDYWRQQLSDHVPALALPLDHLRPAILTNRGAQLPISIDQSLIAGMRSLVRTQGATLYMGLLAAFQTLLCRYSGQTDILVGSPIAGRLRTETEGLIGFFVNTLILRANFAGLPSFVHVLKQVREVTLGAYAHQDVPFEKLVEVLAPERDLSRTPFFQVMFVLQNAPQAVLRLGSASLQSLPLDNGTSKFDLTLTIIEDGFGVQASVTFNTHLFEAASIQRMFEHFNVLLEGIVSAPKQSIASLPLLTSAERRHIVLAWNQTAAEFPQQCVHNLFQAQVLRTPHAAAVQHEAKQLTYSELNRRVNQLARYLRKMGVGPDVCVGLYTDRSVEMVLGMLGIMKAGGAYVPIDPSYPPERVRYLLEGSNSPVLVTRHALISQLPASYPGKPVDLDEQWTEISQESFENPESVSSPENLAYVIYTSGSTGTPKGVAVEHRQLVNYVHGITARLEPKPRWRYGLVSTYAADLGYTVLFTSLCTGGFLDVVHADKTLDSKALGERWKRHPIDCLKIVPSHLRGLLNGMADAFVLPRQWLVTGGEASNWELVEQLRQVSPRLRLLNHYGPTETTVGVLTFPVTDVRRDASTVPLGKPLPNSCMYVLNDQMEPAPVGVAGELYIGGCGLARGYKNQPGMTAERFVPSPFAAEPGARLYRTGDRVRYLSDGNLEFLGRVDDQVKIRGFRIELGEIEAALRQHPALKNCAVVVREDVPGEKRLVAYAVAQGEASLEPAELRSFLRGKLPEYMLPEAFVALSDLPLTANGKLNRHALPQPGSEMERGDREGYVAPRTPIEELVAQIWAGVLLVDRVGAEDNFFALGGHSLRATQVSARINKAFHVDFPLRELFENPTVARLAAAIELRLQGKTRHEAPPIATISRAGDIPLSYAQQRLWFIEQLLPDKSTYSVPRAIRIYGSLDAGILEKSFQEIIRRHESLRTRFASAHGTPRQVVQPSLHFELSIIDLDHVAPDSREEEARRLAQAEAETPFDLQNGPLFRVKLLRMADDDWVLVLNMHHIVSDAWSAGILVRELSTLYNAFIAGKSPSLPSLPVQYADFSAWQRQWIQGEYLDRELEYWRTQLSGLEPLELPTDRPRPAIATTAGVMLAFAALNADLTEELKQLGRRQGATLYMTLLAAFQTILYRYSGQNDIAVGSPIAGRTQAETEGVIGFFVNTLVLRLNLSGKPGFSELLTRVKEVTLQAYAHQDVPFEKLVETIVLRRDLARTPLFQVAFAVQNVPQSELRLGSSRMEHFHVHNGTSKFDLTLALLEDGPAMNGWLEYNTDLFDNATVDIFIHQYRILLRGLVNNPSEFIDELPLISDEERAMLLQGWSGPSTPRAPVDICAAISTHAQQNPEALALIFGKQQLTYGQLNERASQVAGRLRALGLQSGNFVAVCLNHPPDLPVACLAVMKVGAAFVPVGTDWPASYRSHVLANARVSTLVTDLAAEKLDYGLKLLRIDEDDSESPVPDDQSYSPKSINLDSIACVLYRSSPGGKPAGTLVTHRGLYASVFGSEQDFTPHDRIALTLNFAQDSTCRATFVALAAGSCLISLGDQQAAPPLNLATQLRDHGATVALTSPEIIKSVSQKFPWAFKNSRLIFCDGVSAGSSAWSTIKPDLMKRIYLTYSLVEAGGSGFLYPAANAVSVTGVTPVIHICSGATLHLIDDAFQPVPPNVPGELFIAGEGLALGYQEKAEQTARRFPPDIHSTTAGGRLCRTGLLARRRADGQIEFRGRNDLCVSISGVRVELEEAEHVLAQHPELADAGIISERTANKDDFQLRALVVPREGSEVTAEDLRDFIARFLPPVAVPGHYTFVKAIARTTSGKIDRKALEKTAKLQDTSAQVEYVAPRNELEEQLAQIWVQTLSLDRVGINENFFSIGGHSLLATQVMARVSDVFHLEVPLRNLFEAPTIAGFAKVVERIRQEKGTEVAQPSPSIKRLARKAVSLSQESR